MGVGVGVKKGGPVKGAAVSGQGPIT
jgi:hypothetical protein